MSQSPTKTDVLVREATADDVPAIQAIYAHYVTAGLATFEIEAPDETEMVRRFKTLTDGGYPYIVADAAGEIAGYAYAGPYRARPAYRHTVENSVYVAPAFVGRGLGRVLVEDLIQRCTAAGFRQMIAVISDLENRASFNLHTRCGFEHAGTLKNVGYKMGRWVDTALMQRPLGESDTTDPT